MHDAERAHAMDALRAGAMVLVVVAHATLPHLTLPLGHVPWAVRDVGSNALTHLFWWLYASLMPLFFLLAGFFAVQTLAARGPRVFLRQRTQRILRPFLLGCAVLLPITFYVFAIGWWLSGDCTWNDIRRVKFAVPIQSELFGPAHLWFLEYLFIYCALYAALQTWRARSATAGDASGSYAGLLSSNWRLLWCAIPTALILAVHPDVFTTHRNSFLPPPFRLLYYGVFFAAGLALYQGCARLPGLRGGTVFLVLSCFLVPGVELFVRSHRLAVPSLAGRLLFAVLVAGLVWSSLSAALGLATAMCTRARPALRYLADASYWVYLTHLPILAALQILLAQMNAPAALKLALASGATVSLCLWLYERLGWPLSQRQAVGGARQWSAERMKFSVGADRVGARPPSSV